MEQPQPIWTGETTASNGAAMTSTLNFALYELVLSVRAGVC